MLFKNYKYSGMIVPTSYLLDLLIINLLAYYLPLQFQYPILFYTYINLAWIIIAVKTEFYGIYRYTKVTRILILLFRQFFFFFLILYAFIGFFKQPNISRLTLAQFLTFSLIVISTAKFFNYYFLMKYRAKVKGNLRNVVIIGKNKKADQLRKVFLERTEYGYNFVKQFSTSGAKFDLQENLRFIIDHNIDEIYCSVASLKNDELSEIINFADNHLKTLKFIPDNKQIYTKKLKFEYYDYIPVLSLRDIALHNPLNSFIKRSFDFIFALIVIVGLLSWLTPLMALIITIESKGPVFFRQYRKGYDFNLFACYKFRSMAMNNDFDNKQATKNDMRITRVGRFIRKTSMDELPQFYNVLMGNMSVVGPRPLLIKHTNDYVDKIQKFMLRHYVKPGITGLAQVKGYRGEIEQDSDMKNRVRFDIFYVENWSLFLDMKIIVQTVLNVIKGEEKAY